MKKYLLSIIFNFLAFYGFSQSNNTFNFIGLKELIGNRAIELEEKYNISASKIDDNFGDLTISYNDVNIEPYILDIVVKTKDKNITDIVVKNSTNKTLFFKNIASELEKEAPQKKNYKTYYISLVKNSSKKKIYHESVDQLIEYLKNNPNALKDNYGLFESSPLKSILMINDNESTLMIN